MPASSISALNSWGLYLVAAVALLLVLSPALAAGERDAREGVDVRNVEGVGALLSSLRPGVAVKFSFGPPGFADAILLSGHDVSSAYGSGTTNFSAPFDLPRMVLSPGVNYVASAGAGRIEVVPAG